MTGPHLTLFVAGAWAEQGLCGQADPEAFFPDKGCSPREAKRICNGDPAQDIAACPVRAECLEHALENDENFGIWGGLTAHQRRALRAEAVTCPDCGTRFKGVKGLAGHRNGRGECATQRKAAVA